MRAVAAVARVARRAICALPPAVRALRTTAPNLLLFPCAKRLYSMPTVNCRGRAACCSWVLLLLLAVVEGESTSNDSDTALQVWVVAGATAVLLNDTAPTSVATLEVDLAGQRAETEHAQIVVRSAHALHNVKLTFGQLCSVSSPREHMAPLCDRAIPGSSVEYLQVGYVYCSCDGYCKKTGSPSAMAIATGWKPDPLLPVPDSGVSLVPANTTQPFFVRLRIPEGTVPGVYEGAARLSARTVEGGRAMSVVVPMRVTVWNGTLPTNLLDSDEFGTMYGFDEDNMPKLVYTSGEWYPGSPMQQRWYTFFAQRGVGINWDLEGKNSLPNETAIDQLLNSGDHSVEIIEAARLGQAIYSTNYSQTYINNLLDALAPVVSRLRKSGKLNATLAYGFDERPQSMEYALRQVFGAIRDHYPELRTVAALNWDRLPNDLPLNIWVHGWMGYWGGLNYSLNGKGFANYSNPLVMGNASKAAEIDSWVGHGNVGAAGTTERKYYWYYCDGSGVGRWLSPQWVQAPPISHRALLLMAAATDIVQGLLYWTMVDGWVSRLPYNGTAWANVTTTGAAPHGYTHSPFVERVNGTMYTSWIPTVRRKQTASVLPFFTNIPIVAQACRGKS